MGKEYRKMKKISKYTEREHGREKTERTEASCTNRKPTAPPPIFQSATSKLSAFTTNTSPHKTAFNRPLTFPLLTPPPALAVAALGNRTSGLSRSTSGDAALVVAYAPDPNQPSTPHPTHPGQRRTRLYPPLDPWTAFLLVMLSRSGAEERNMLSEVEASYVREFDQFEVLECSSVMRAQVVNEPR